MSTKKIQAHERAKGWRDTHIKAEFHEKLAGFTDKEGKSIIPDDVLLCLKCLCESEYKETVPIYDSKNEPHLYNAVYSGNGAHASQALFVDTIIEGLSKSKYRPSDLKNLVLGGCEHLLLFL
jgi:hypothetical protein